MKALVKAERAPGIWLKEIPEPKLGANDVRIRIRKTAICGTDMHIYSWDAWAQKTIPVPMAVGHEYSGEIVEIGSEVQGLAIGDGYRARATSPAATAATAARGGATCAATPWASASTDRVASRSTW
jgi:threonine 3-dehydrogenase